MRIERVVRAGFTLIEIMITVLIIGILLAIAIPNFVTARENARQTSCIANLMQIRSAKEQWAGETKQASTATPTDEDLFGSGKYIDFKPQCPSGGIYTLNTLSKNPRCSFTTGDYPHRIRDIAD